MDSIQIAGRPVGEGSPCLIIAEAGVNHNGDPAVAERLIDAAKAAGANAVKFQSFKAAELVSRRAQKASYQKRDRPGESQLEMLQKLELSDEVTAGLFAYACEKGIMFLSTPFDRHSADMLDSLGMAAFKLPSGEITNLPLLRFIGSKGKPVLLSTGMSTMKEIREALGVLRSQGAQEIVLLHCVSAYPAKIEDMNLRVMHTLRRTFKLPVGLSDHSLGIAAPIAAAALGAVVIEKHLTLDRKLPGPDHAMSLEPEKFRHMVQTIRDVEKALGDGVKRLTAEEKENRKAARRSIVAGVDIAEGSIIVAGMLALKRAGGGLSPKYLEKVAGKTAKKAIRQDEAITWNKLR